MLKIATIFSGIGAIEQAANRLEIDHKIVFACDNGGVNTFKKSRIFYPEEIDHKLVELENKINILTSSQEDFSNKITEDFFKFKNKISKNNQEFNKIKFSYDFNSILSYLIEIKPKKYKHTQILDNNLSKISFLLNLKIYLTPALIKKYNYKFLINLKKELNEDSVLENILNIFKDYKNDLVRLDEVICTEVNKKELCKISSYSEKKEYVNSLYKKYNCKNFVKKSYLENYDLNEENFHWNVSYLDGNEYKGKVD
ncbi:MAG: hypothetical protein ACRCZR_03445, partial [Cetobacterium sp.]